MQLPITSWSWCWSSLNAQSTSFFTEKIRSYSSAYSFCKSNKSPETSAKIFTPFAVFFACRSKCGSETANMRSPTTQHKKAIVTTSKTGSRCQ